MPNEFSRSRRVAEQIKRELAPLAQERVQDETKGLVTLTGVEVSPDLRHARVYFTLLGGQLDHGAVQKLLNEGSAELRYRLAHGIRAKRVPDLRFLYDESVERGAHLSALIDATSKSD